MRSCERRKYRRLAVTLDLSCRKVGSSTQQFYTGHTVNVSPGGLYFETATDAFEQKDLLKLEFAIPPTEGLLEFGGRISGLGRVLRTHNIRDCRSPTKYGVALEFCQSPKLST